MCLPKIYIILAVTLGLSLISADDKRLKLQNFNNTTKAIPTLTANISKSINNNSITISPITGKSSVLLTPALLSQKLSSEPPLPESSSLNENELRKFQRNVDETEIVELTSTIDENLRLAGNTREQKQVLEITKDPVKTTTTATSLLLSSTLLSPITHSTTAFVSKNLQFLSFNDEMNGRVLTKHQHQIRQQQQQQQPQQQENRPISPSLTASQTITTSSSASTLISLDENIILLPRKSTIITSTTTTTTRTTTAEISIPTNGYFNVTSQVGTHAYLPCNVKQFVKKPISWIRIRDGHILTVDQTTFIADQRFQSIVSEYPERWSLQIKFVQPNDSGWYECQVSTEPKSSAKINLNIVKPQTKIIGESTRHVKAGSPVKIRCTISEALEPPLFINWYFNDKQIYLHNSRNRWKTEIDRETALHGGSNERNLTIASLIISSVTKTDSGNYTCQPSNSESATIVLHVLNGEFSASAITSSAARITTPTAAAAITSSVSACGLWSIFQKYYNNKIHNYNNDNHRFILQNTKIIKIIILCFSYICIFKTIISIIKI